MNTSANRKIIPEPLAVDVRFPSADTFVVVLADGREISVPLEWSEKLHAATPQERANWRVIGTGVGIHWEDIDEDISVESILRLN